MMRSLYSGVSGLQNHQTRMDVIGNNIANINTVGFKKGRVNFQDMLSQNMQGAARPTENVGGVNPKQVGLGMSVASIDTIHTQGSMQTTGKTDDVAVQGEGMFVMRNGDKLLYTRAGAFSVDENGTFVNPANGLKVQGWMAENINGEIYLNASADPGDITIPVGGKDPAQATTEVLFASNLNKFTPEILDPTDANQVAEGTITLNKKIYDSNGGLHELAVTYTRVIDAPNTWNVAIEVDPGETTNTLVDIGAENNATNAFVMEFDNFGVLTNIRDAQGDTLDTEKLSAQVSFDVLDSTPDADGNLQRQTFDIVMGEVGSTVNSSTQFEGQSSNKAYSQNGYGMGYLTSYKIDQSGVITGVYSNGTNKTIAQMALATFTNTSGLEKAGESTYVETINSGEANIGVSGIAGKGKFIAGALEMSNVDLSEQFTEMIITQRGLQANSKTIQTSDTILQELLTLKR